MRKPKSFVCTLCGKVFESMGSSPAYCPTCRELHTKEMKRKYELQRRHKYTGNPPGRPKKINFDTVIYDEPEKDDIITHAEPMGYAISAPGWTQQ